MKECTFLVYKVVHSCYTKVYSLILQICTILQQWFKMLKSYVKLSYFIKTKYTANIRQTKAAKWFQCNDSPLNKTVVKTVKITKVITSCIIFNCIKLKGPPFPLNPKRLAGIWKVYSFNITYLPMTGKHIIFAPNIMQLPWTIKKQ